MFRGVNNDGNFAKSQGGINGVHTGYCRSMPTTFPSCDENDVALTRIDIVVLQYEQLVNPIFLQRVDLDDGSNWTNETFVKDEVFFPANL